MTDFVGAMRATCVERFGEPAEVHVFDASSSKDAPPLARVEVLVWRPDDEVEMTTLATVGMSERRMPGADWRAELHLAVRGPLAPGLERELARFLAHVACYPFDHDRTIDWWHVLAQPGAIPAFPSCTAALLHPRFVEKGWDETWVEDEQVRILNVVPITEEERAVRRGGPRALHALWAERQVDIFQDRPSTPGPDRA